MTSILDVADDAVFCIVDFLTPLEFLLISQTCLHFQRINDPLKHLAINTFWQQHCERLWTLVKQNKYKHDKYSVLFKSMIDFLAHIGPKKMKNVLVWKQKLYKKAYNMETCIDKVDEVPKEDILARIIESDNLEMFKVCTCNMNDQDINQDINDVVDVPASILFVVIKHNAIKIATYLLGPSKDGNYIFPKMDIGSPEKSGFKYSPLTLAAYYKHVEIVSLLINHPNMTKELINKSNSMNTNHRTPLHAACVDPSFFNTFATKEDAVAIVEILINSRKINVNCVDKYDESALMRAITLQPQAASVLIDNENVDVNMQDDKGNTALHYGARSKSAKIELIKKLLQRKDIDINVKNNDGKTALDVAKERDFLQKVDLLASYQAEYS